MYDRPYWPPRAEIGAQAFDDFAEWCLAHPDDCILKQAELYADDIGWHRGIRYYVEIEQEHFRSGVAERQLAGGNGGKLRYTLDYHSGVTAGTLA